MGEPWFTTAFGAHYPLLYAHRDEEEAARCVDLLPRLAPLAPGGAGLPVLDLGCGDGRHLVLLAGRMQVVGVDLSPHLLRAARERLAGHKGLQAGLLRADMRDLPLAEGVVGAVLSLFTAFGYFGSIGENSIVIEEVARVMVSGGHWFLDYLDCDRVRAELAAAPDGLWRERVLGPCLFTEHRRLDRGGEVVAKEVTVTPVPGRETEAAGLGVPGQGLRYIEQVALFAPEELDALAAASGLERTAAAGGYDGVPLGEGDRWILVYRKREGASS